MECIFCEGIIDQPRTGEPYLEFKDKPICSNCYIGIIPEIYKMAGAGDGGFINLMFNKLVSSSYNRKSRSQVSGYKKVLTDLKHKYKFKCVTCGSKSNLTIDHKIPVSKGGGDEVSNLQLMCKSCNSKKGAKIDEPVIHKT